jgi:hypothetical protein
VDHEQAMVYGAPRVAVAEGLADAHARGRSDGRELTVTRLKQRGGWGGSHRGLQRQRGDADWASDEREMMVTLCPHQGSELGTKG